MNMNVEALKNGVKMPEITKKLPKVAVAAGISGLIVAALILMTPNTWFEAFIVKTGLPSLISAAAPPLGAQARIVFALIAALLVTVFAYFGLKAVMASKLGQAISDPVSVYDLDDEAFADAPTLRRADAHPDHPPRAPIMANDEMGTPLDLVDVAEETTDETDKVEVDPIADFNAESPLWDKPMKATPEFEAPEPEVDFDDPNFVPTPRKRTFGPQSEVEPDAEPEVVADAEPEVAVEPEPEVEPEVEPMPEAEVELPIEAELDVAPQAEDMSEAAEDDLDDDYEVVEWDETGEDGVEVAVEAEAEPEPEPEPEPELVAEPVMEEEASAPAETDFEADAQADIQHAVETLSKPDIADADVSGLMVRLEAGLERRKMRLDKAQEVAENAAQEDNVAQHPGVAQAVPEDDMDGALREALDALKKVTAKGA